MTRKEFNKGIVILEKMNLVNPPDFSEEVIESAWYETIKNLSNKDFMRAINKIIVTNTYFPRLPDIIAAAIPANIIPAETEWENVESEITRCCGRPGVMWKLENTITCRVVESMGGIEGIWLSATPRSFLRKQFIEHYNRLVSSQMQVLLAGPNVKELEG